VKFRLISRKCCHFRIVYEIKKTYEINEISSIRNVVNTLLITIMVYMHRWASLNASSNSYFVTVTEAQQMFQLHRYSYRVTNNGNEKRNNDFVPSSGHVNKKMSCYPLFQLQPADDSHTEPDIGLILEKNLPMSGCPPPIRLAFIRGQTLVKDDIRLVPLPLMYLLYVFIRFCSVCRALAAGDNVSEAPAPFTPVPSNILWSKSSKSCKIRLGLTRIILNFREII
jgi:hypothetical protein